MKYAEMDWGTMEAVVNKLGGMEGVKRFLRGEIAVGVASVFTFLTSVKFGTKKSANDYRKAIKAAGNRISDWASDILGKMPISDTEIELDLVTATVRELGFEDGATFNEICERGMELGMELCPAEVGPALRLQYQDQPKDEWLIIAMEAITDSDGGPHVFSVHRDRGGRWLYSRWSRPGHHWPPGSRFVFVRRK